MDTKQILADLRAERNRIDQAIAALEALDATGTPAARTTRITAAAPKQHRGRRRMSAAGRKRISDAAKAMWARRKRAAPARHMSAATKRKLSLLAKARWAERKKKEKTA